MRCAVLARGLSVVQICSASIHYYYYLHLSSEFPTDRIGRMVVSPRSPIGRHACRMRAQVVVRQWRHLRSPPKERNGPRGTSKGAARARPWPSHRVRAQGLNRRQAMDTARQEPDRTTGAGPKAAGTGREREQADVISLASTGSALRCWWLWLPGASVRGVCAVGRAVCVGRWGL